MLVRHLGLRDYTEVRRLCEKLAYQRSEGDIPDTLLLAQHPPTYTCGRATRKPGKRLPFPLLMSKREGGLCYHGPGQLVGYPVFHLGEHRLDAATYRKSLAAVLTEALRSLGVQALRRRREDGLWSGGKRLAFIGTAVRRRVSCQGFSLNINCDLSPFHYITPPGDHGWTSLAELLGRPLDETLAVKAVAEAFLRYF